ncbi:hypothetical protein ACFY9N_08185 [Microbacterium sp. NPDC008134]|jgi:hypothetical protein|uniref:hypothetical protein n=1 Tax=Microbacterium sp. NPDC008134 TaxID=3364183 RepID=UPI0036EA8AE3
MKRQIAAWTIAVVAVLGIAGCSSTPSAESDSDTSTSSESSAPAEQNTEQSVAEACSAVSSEISGVATELSSLDMSAAMADPEGTVATFTETVDAIGAAADSVDNAEVKEAVTAVHEDFVSLRDLLSKVLIDQDTSAAAEASTLSTDIQESTQAFMTLCAG